MPIFRSIRHAWTWRKYSRVAILPNAWIIPDDVADLIVYMPIFCSIGEPSPCVAWRLLSAMAPGRCSGYTSGFY